MNTFIQQLNPQKIDIKKSFLSTKSKRFLKDHVTLKTGVMTAEKSAFISGIFLIYLFIVLFTVFYQINLKRILSKN